MKCYMLILGEMSDVTEEAGKTLSKLAHKPDNNQFI